MAHADLSLRRADFGYRLPVQVRWADFDMFGHFNNVTYFRFYESLITTFLQNEAGLDWMAAPVAPFVAENSCRYLKPIDHGPAAPFGGSIDACLRVDHLGAKSVRYGLALFQNGDEEPAATGQWVHVFVDRKGGGTAPIPDVVRACFTRFLAADASADV